MKTQCTPKRLAIGVLALGLISTSPLAAQSAAGSTRSTSQLSGQQNLETMTKVSDVIGKDVHSSDGERLGRINDLVIDRSSGEVRFAVISSGGVLGIGGQRRAVEFDAIQHDRNEDRITVEQSAYDNAQEFRQDELASLEGGASASMTTGQTGVQRTSATTGAQRTTDRTQATSTRTEGSTTDDVGGTMTAATPRARTSANVGTLEDSPEIRSEYSDSEAGTPMVPSANQSERTAQNDRAMQTDRTAQANQPGARAGAGATATASTQGSQDRSRTTSQEAEGSSLILVSDLEGKEVRSGERSIGEITELVIDTDRGQAAALVDVSDEVAQAEQPFVVSFDRLTVSGSREDLQVDSQLSEADFQTTGAMTATTGGSSSNRPYPWQEDTGQRTAGSTTVADNTTAQSGVSSQRSTTSDASPSSDSDASAPVGAAEQNVQFADATRNPQNRPTAAGSDSESSPEQQVRQALDRIGSSADDVDVSVQGDRVVLSGTVASETARNRILMTARSAAPDRTVEDQMTVSAAAE